MTKAEIREKEEEIIEFSGCQLYVDTPVKRYSSGMRVRLAFAVAAHLEPDILVVDEVLAVGDAEFQKKAIGKMKDISGNDGRTVLFVSHDMAAIQNLCKRLIVLKNGTVDFEGDVNDGVDFYLRGDDEKNNSFFNDKFVKKGVAGLVFKNSEGSIIDNLIVGQKVQIEIEYLNLKKLPLSFSITFTDTNGVFKFGCRSDTINVYFSNSKGKAILEIPKWPLSEGLYNYNILTHYRGQQEQFVKKAGSINIYKGDFYGTGKLPGMKKAFYIDYSWR
jgi:lipopolysaccharide transport system ATP-binding protein